jgi:Redoxin
VVEDSSRLEIIDPGVPLLGLAHWTYRSRDTRRSPVASARRTHGGGSLSQKLRNVGELAIVVACVVVVTDAVWSRVERLWPTRTQPSAPVQSAQAHPMYAVGDAAPSVGVNYAAAGKTLLMVVRSGCSFCTESMPFYRKLKTEASAKGVKIVALTSDPLSTFRPYVASQGVDADDVISIDPRALKVRATPTLLLVDSGGKITSIWMGRLKEAEENGLVAALGGAAH